MSELVREHEDAEHEQKRQDCRHAFNSSAWTLCRAPSKSSVGSDRASQRSGYEQAYWIGSRMSVIPSWAITEPSINSTSEWTIDCGWMTTSIWSALTPNSQCASITSSPLFISVA